jgi:parallel beta-helix repeat protein
LAATFGVSQSVRGDEPQTLIVERDTTLDPERSYSNIVIKASDVTIDGRGAWLVGAAGGDPREFRGTAITATGVSNVTLRNVNAKGWETGLSIKDASGWTIEGCDFSDNFHDPRFGWGENGRRGGIVLERVTHCTLRKNKANRVWDGCVLIDSRDNLLEENDFSHTSNTCLKLWTASRNIILRNNLSWGLRIDRGEVHARDSTCVLIESGSNDNRFLGNDCTHGGDGIFVRVLNGWVSTGNVFEENDCSYANNNCVEAWSPRNTWLRNKANHGSYGFWLGASDQNVLIENEACFNGLPDGFHNSPHLPDDGHAGIVFMFGPSSHTIVRGNRCEGNNGAGIAAIGDLESKGRKWNAFHWIIEQNTLVKNRWGIYLQHAQMFDVAANVCEGHAIADVHLAENVTGLIERTSEDGVMAPPRAVLGGPSVVKAGAPVTFDAAGSTDAGGRSLAYRWFVWPDAAGTAAALSRTFDSPGFYRVALTVNNGLLSDLAWRDVYVVEDVAELGTEEDAGVWSWIDPDSEVRFTADPGVALLGRSSLRADVEPYSGGRVTLRCTLPEGPNSLEGKTRLVFWLKTRNEHVPAWQDVNPLVALIGPDGARLQLTPARDFLSAPPYNEAREGWTHFAVPLAGSDDWRRSGAAIGAVQSIELGFDSWGAPPLVLWVDGLGVK